MISKRGSIPFALDASRNIVWPAESSREASPGSYFCPNCDRELRASFWRNKAPYLCFKHARKNGDGCELARGKVRNQQVHDTAVRVLQKYIDAALHQGRNWLRFEIDTVDGKEKLLPLLFAKRAQREWTCPVSGRRADIAILDKNEDPVLLIEVYHSHAVDEKKALDYAGYKWIEVDARHVVEEDLSLLPIRNHGNFPAFYAMSGRQSRLF